MRTESYFPEISDPEIRTWWSWPFISQRLKRKIIPVHEMTFHWHHRTRDAFPWEKCLVTMNKITAWNNEGCRHSSKGKAELSSGSFNKKMPLLSRIYLYFYFYVTRQRGLKGKWVFQCQSISLKTLGKWKETNINIYVWCCTGKLHLQTVAFTSKCKAISEPFLMLSFKLGVSFSPWVSLFIIIKEIKIPYRASLAAFLSSLPTEKEREQGSLCFRSSKVSLSKESAQIHSSVASVDLCNFKVWG